MGGRAPRDHPPSWGLCRMHSDPPPTNPTMRAPDSTLDLLVARAQQLYTLPAVAMEVLELTGNPKVDAHALKACIENDPAMTSKLLRVVNSSLFGLGREVSDLNQALTLLGIKPLKLLVLGFSLPEGLFDGMRADMLEYYWRHALTKAVVARELSETLWRQAGDEAFLAGLLQDLGMLLMIQELGAPYGKLLQRVQEHGEDLFSLETESMGFDHTRLTSRLLSHWGLPEVLVQAVCWPGGPPPDGERPLTPILYLAELLARLLADRRSEVLGEILESVRKYHDLSNERLESIVEDLETKVRQLAEVFSLSMTEGLDYADILTRAHAQLVDVAASAAGDLLRKNSLEEDARTASRTEDVRSLCEAVDQVAQGGLPRMTAVPPPEPALAGTVHSATASVASSTAVELSDKGPAATLLEQLTAVVGACRHTHCSVSLLLAELGKIQGEALTEAKTRLETACRHLDHPLAICLENGPRGYAIILPRCDRQLAVELGNQLIESLTGRSRQGYRMMLLGIGAATVALPPKNFPPGELFDAANRCLYGSHAAGGNLVKSIEIY